MNYSHEDITTATRYQTLLGTQEAVTDMLYRHSISSMGEVARGVFVYRRRYNAIEAGEEIGPLLAR
ncbi:hypothetical protein ACQKP8_18895 [Photobacterium alginatilyticum]|uniref:hypothetical protein n=1 Tax=Photobacterium alginatilyticum TaxID=1775171 RepID=UPI004068B307